MRNLTARRCRHVGRFTAANFGIPGDKPRFCLAHSTEDMVNHNKSRGGKGMGIIPSRSPWRSTKTTVSVYDGKKTNNKESRMLEAAEEADAHASERSAGVGNSPVSGGKGIIMRAVRSTPLDNGDYKKDVCDPLSPKPLTNAWSRGSGRSAVTSVVNGSPVPPMALTSRGLRSSGVMSQKHSLSPMPVFIPMAHWRAESRTRTGCMSGRRARRAFGGRA